MDGVFGRGEGLGEGVAGSAGADYGEDWFGHCFVQFWLRCCLRWGLESVYVRREGNGEVLSMFSNIFHQ